LTVAITLGDVNGIGPEVALKAVYRAHWPPRTRFILIGAESIARELARRLRLPPPGSGSLAGKGSRVVVWNPVPSLEPAWRPGRLQAAAGAAAAAWIEAAVRGCLDGRFDAMCTAPISKEGLQKGGADFPGHTEMLAHLTGTSRFGMMLIGGPLRVMLATRHLPLRDVPAALDAPGILEAIELTAKALPWLGCRRARVGICGLNPHAGEGGKIGREEIDVIRPAIQQARRRGFDVAGPLPGDTAFHHAARGEYDAVVAMYHDQGLAPLKTLAFDHGVNLTLGLPIVRTSPDHGTAYAIAGKNRANPSSMIEALRLAIALAQRPLPWKP